MPQPYSAAGALESAGVDITLILGFEPTYFRMINRDAAAGAAFMLEWQEGMSKTDGKSLVSNKIVDSGATGAANLGSLAAGGITIDAIEGVSAVDPISFTGGYRVVIPAAAFHAAGDDLLWFALR